MRQLEPLSFPTTGLKLRAQLVDYLKLRRDIVDKSSRNELFETLKMSWTEDGQRFPISDEQFFKLVDASMTIGTNGPNRVYLRLKATAIEQNWPTQVNLQRTAHDIHLLADKMRKLKNALAQESKCARAVLRTSRTDSQFTHSEPWQESNFELSARKLTTPLEVERWAKDSFDYFTQTTEVDKRFYSVYEKAWRNFQDAAIPALLNKSSNKSLVESKFEAYLIMFKVDSKRFQIRWGEPTDSLNNSSEKSVSWKYENYLPEIVLQKRTNELAFLIKLESIDQTNIRELPIELLIAVETETKFTNLDVSTIDLSSKSFKLTILGSFNKEQMLLAQDVILKFFERKRLSTSRETN